MAGRSGYTSFIVLSFFNLDFTFDQCLTNNLSALTRLLLQYITPLYILLLLVIILVMTRLKGFSKYLGNHSFLQALWLLVLISYLNIANSTFEIVHCHKIGPRNRGSTEFVLVYDASILCWSGNHLPWAILAVLLAVFLILPFPIYTWLAIRFPKLKPITDVYTNIYRDYHRYWVIWNLLRRVMIVMLSVFVVNFIYRHFSLLLASVLVLVIFVITRPYKYWLDNAFGGFVSTSLVVFCIVTEPTLYEYFDPHRIVSWSIVTSVVFFSILLMILEGLLGVLPRWGHRYTKDDLIPDLVKFKLIGWKVKITRKIRKQDRYSVELEESASAEYFGASRYSYSEYREPLIDSVQYSPKTTSYADSKKIDTDESKCSSDISPINAGSTTVSVTHSIV